MLVFRGVYQFAFARFCHVKCQHVPFFGDVILWDVGSLPWWNFTPETRARSQETIKYIWKRVPVGGSSANKIFQTQDVVSYNATITACEKGSHWEEAMLLLYEVQKPGDQSERKPDSSGRNAKCFKDDLTLQLVKFDQIHTNSLKWWDVGMEKCQWIWQL